MMKNHLRKRNIFEYVSYKDSKYLTHELGHVYLHPNINTFIIKEIYSTWSSDLEIEADTFTSKLCVSTELIKLKYDNLSVDKKKEFEEFYNDNYSFLHPI